MALSTDVAQRLLTEGVSQNTIGILGNEEYILEQDLKQAGFTPESLRAMGIKGKSIDALLRLYGREHQGPVTPAFPTSITLEVPGTTRCAKCTNILEENAEFCPRCSTPVASKLVCIKCDKQGGAGETFCSNDGIELVPAIDALCLRELMTSENMSINEAGNALKEMDPIRRSKLQDKAMRRQQGGGPFEVSPFPG